MWRRVRMVWVVVLASAVAARAGATVLIGADLGELTRDARAIARGRVVAIDAQWTDDRRTIETLVTLEVERYLKGSLGGTLQFRVPGGELGRFRSIVVGAPVFALDERVVVFLGAQGPSIPHVLGLSQGVFRVAQAGDRDRWMVTPAPFGPSTATVRLARGDANRRPLPLAVFERRVAALVAGAR